MRIACVIPTYNGREELERLLESLIVQTVDYDLMIVDSNSTDGTGEIGKAGADIFMSIEKSSFNHGGTRQMMVDRFPNYDIFIFLTQDAVLSTENALEKLVSNFIDPEIGAVCARQLPHLDANPFARHARLFNYPPHSRIVDKAAIGQFGLKAAFMSNSFAAYRYEALIGVGGFPTNVILAEDMLVAARMVLSNWKVAYDGEAACRHSHNYSILEEFKRYFDLGVFHARDPWIRQHLGGASGEGRKYVLSELKYLSDRKMLWPASIWRNAVKLAGYKLGQYEYALPVMLKQKLSMHRGFWD